MAGVVPQFATWRNAKALSRKLQFDKAIALYRSVEFDMANLQQWRPEKSERDNAFDQALFFGDYCGALANERLYADAEEKGNIALEIIKKHKFTSLKYVYYNFGNIFLFQKDYARALPWYETALDGARYFYTIIDYLINYGTALFHLELFDKAKETFLLAIKDSKDTKYNKCFEPFFYMEKLCNLQNEEKESRKYNRMYRTRLKKYTQREIEVATATMPEKDEILADYESVCE